MDVMSDLASLEEIAGQGALHANGRTGFGWSIPPNIERASAVREIKREPPASDAGAETPTPIAHGFYACEVKSYSELIGAIRQKVAMLGVRYLDFDVLAGFAPGLTGKSFGACEAKRLGLAKTFDALRAAGLRIRVEDDPEQTAKMKARIAENFLPRQANQARPNHQNYIRPSEQLIERVLKYLANNRGGLGRLNRSVKEARSNWAQHANEVRWGRRDTEVEGAAAP
jgi:hypothetical protein